MKKAIRNVLAIILGLVLGSVVNMGLIMTGGDVVSPPQGADITTMEGLKASMHLFEAKNFIFPFLAHALGTFVGAVITALIAANYKMRYAFGIGATFMLGGIINSFLFPAPSWFIVLDLMAAYIPMAWFGGKLALALHQKSTNTNL
ncbi:hypothetical protein [Sediminicola arcticus]|jgi:hypothetical protein|uniref:Uncharacterized protein n=1 Tax=Sediminicola arcticus TaxID=1574308 RepID=A0ABV2SX95_9FLAO|tara:strand:+ start:514 stop:951 length:438 start_codon:yes stop_codon:yes gene_type:complete